MHSQGRGGSASGFFHPGRATRPPYVINTSLLVGEAVHLVFGGEDALAVGVDVVRREED